MTKAKDWVKNYLRDLGLAEDEAKLEILTDDFNKRYAAAVRESTSSNETPRTSTAPQSLENLERSGNILIDQEGRALGNFERKAGILGDARGVKMGQNLDYVSGVSDVKTRNALALLGGTQMDAINANNASKERVVGMKTDYNAGYDSKLLSAIDKIHERENSGQIFDFVKQLAGTAAMLAM